MTKKGSPPTTTAVPAVSEDSVIAVAVDNDKNSHHALKWAADHLIGRSQIFFLLHVRKRAVFRAGGNYGPVLDDEDEGEEEASATINESEMQVKELLLPFQCLCSMKGLQCKEIVLDDTDISKAILNFVAVQMVDKLVLGASSRNILTRTFLTDVPYTVMKSSPDFCSVYVISKGKLVSSKSALYTPVRRSPALELLTAEGTQFQSVKSEPEYRNHVEPSTRMRTNNSTPAIQHYSRNGYDTENRTREQMYNSIASCPSPSRPSRMSFDRPQNFHSNLELLDHDQGRQTANFASFRNHDDRLPRGEPKGFDVNRPLNSYTSSSSGSSSGGQISSASMQQTVAGELRTGAGKDVRKMENNKPVEVEKRFVPEIIDGDFSADVRYRRYSIEEIQNATDNFSNGLKIGEGGYGPVFKSTLDHTPVAIKVLRPDAAQGMKQFQKEIEVLSCIRHPNMVLLMGACPEYGCLVYEYMSNGSLEDRLLCKSNTPPLPWRLRFKIAAEVATALLFLHQSKPEPLVHRDLKPGNILLDHNFVSKIADVGLARLLPSAPPGGDNASMYHMTAAAGTFCYIDPEYQKTGMLGTKSDIYALGIIFLQLITAAPPMGLAHNLERALEAGDLAKILDRNVPDWPMDQTAKFARLALKCAELRRKDRPDLSAVILPELNELRNFALANYGGDGQHWSSVRI